MSDDQALDERLQKYVTVGGQFSLPGVVEASANKMLKMGTFFGVMERFGDEPEASQHAGTFSLLSDEGETLRSGGTAPLPLQYFLAGIAF